MRSTAIGPGTVAGDVGGRAAAFEERFMLAVLVALLSVSIALLVGQSIEPRPVRVAGIAVDRLSAALTLLVTGVGAITFRFSQRYLAGETRRRRFLRVLAATVASACLLMLADNLLLLFGAWSATSVGLHLLLTHYDDRTEALRPARKKFLISRLGDLALIAAIVLIARESGTLGLQEFLRHARESPSNTGAAVEMLVVLAALTKSAQFPFHSWLPETMEAPTPVSALMHAGIINAGGALLLRFAPVLVQSPAALLVLASVGTVTVAVGMLAMWAQVKVKRTLAWSTVAQMGFMMIQCGVAAFPAALLHILGHGCYKAWSFLRSGETPPPGPSAPLTGPGRRLALVAGGFGASIPAMMAASWLTGFSPLHSPGESALAVILALAIGQLWATLLGGAAPIDAGLARRAIAVLVGTVVLALGAFSLYRAAALFLSPVLGDLPAPTGPLAWAAALLPVILLAALTIVHASLPTMGRTPLGRVFYVHALHGFYFGALADRAVDALYRRLVPTKTEVVSA